MFYLMFLINILLSIKPITDPDFGWHITVGKYIFLNHQIPKYDIFSWYGIDNKLEFISHEWLSDLIFYLLGNLGVIVFFVISLIIIFLLLVYLLKIKKNDYINNFIKVLWCFVIVIMLYQFQHRPYLFSYIFFIIFIIIFFKYLSDNLKNRKMIFIIPFIQLAWVNLHGGSSSLILLIIFISIIIMLIIKEYRDYIKIRELTMLFIITICFSLINPYGYKLLLYPFLNMGDNVMLDNIIEWYSPNFHGLCGFYYYLLIAIPFFLIYLCKNKKVHLYDIVFLFLFLFMFLRSIRFYHYYVFYTTYFIGKYLNIEYTFDFKINFIKLKLNTYLFKKMLFAICLVIPLFLVFNKCRDLNQRDNRLYYSDEIVSKIIELNPKKLYNDYDSGGFLTEKLSDSGVHVFINGIADIYTHNIFKDAISLYHLDEDPNEIINKYLFDVIVVKEDSPLKWFLIENNEYTVYFEDDTGIIFYKKID